MGSFQITYDDFSGGQYMGSKSTNLPKNQWFGKNVITTPDGNLIPAQSATAGTYVPPGPSAYQISTIHDHWVLEDVAYAFIDTIGFSPSSNVSRMVSVGVSNGETFPNTPSALSLTGILNGKVAYNPNNFLFYYISTAGNIYSAGGAVALISTALAGLDLRNIATYGFRQVSWGGTNATAKKRLYYSGTDLTTWSTANYYEFNGKIINVLPRSNDLLVFCETGVFSLVGILGASITSQLIVPQENVLEGMASAIAVGRNAYFLDQRLSGAPDGRVYRLTGATTQSVYTLGLTDVNESKTKGQEQMVIGSVNQGRLVVQAKNGYCYAESTPGTWARFYSAANVILAKETNQVRIGQAGPNALNEYFVVASVDNSNFVIAPLTFTRYIHNVSSIEDTNTKFYYTTPQGAFEPIRPEGNVTLSEYWHSKPFTVKEIFVEFYSDTAYIGETPVCTVGITPTGIIDLYTAENGGASLVASEPLVVGTENYNNGTITQRFRPNNAQKGFGVKPTLNIKNVIVKRVILNCED